MKKQIFAILLSTCMISSMPAVLMAEEAEEGNEAVVEETAEAAEESDILNVTLMETPVRGTVSDFAVSADDIVILFNNDVHGGISNDKDYSGSGDSLGYAGLAAVKADVSKAAGAVTMVDLGDAIQGSVVTTETDGKAVMDLMDEVGFDIRIPGNHDFDYGMEAFLDYAAKAGTFISSNFVDNRTGEAVFDGYTIIPYEINGIELKIGYVGMTTPETIAKSTPTYFQDEEGNYIYGFNADTPEALYDNIQASIDAAYENGADMVIGLGHMGDVGVEAGWSSLDVIQNTDGLVAFLDGHAHTVLPGTIVEDKNGEPVILASTGTKLEHIGVLQIGVSEDGIEIQPGLVDALTDEEYTAFEYTTVDEMVQAIEEEFAYLFVKVGSTDFDLVIYDPETGDRLIRKQETNLGDFLADTYREEFDTDIAVINGGSIRANIPAGDITYMQVITVFPWNTTVSVVELTGQTVMEMLEMGAHLYPDECGGYIQVSGLSYTIDPSIPSSVNVNSDGEFVSVDGEYRVKDVMVGGEPIDLEKTYTMAINTYYSSEYGDGMTMFKNAKIIKPAEGEDDIVDHDVVIDHLAHLNDVVPEDYADPYGQGRITILDAAEEADDAA